MSVETRPIEENEAKTLIGTSEGRLEVMNRLEFDLKRSAARLRGMAQAHLILGNDLQAAELHNTVEVIERVYPIFLMLHVAAINEGNDAFDKLQKITEAALQR